MTERQCRLNLPNSVSEKVKPLCQHNQQDQNFSGTSYEAQSNLDLWHFEAK